MRILLVDDHAVVRSGIRHMLEGELEGSTYGEAANALQVITLVKQAEWDICILDLNLDGYSGLDLIRDIKSLRPIPILVLSMLPEELYGLRALRCGAQGYLTKEAPPSTICAAVRQILRGEKYISQALQIQLVAGLDPEKPRTGNDILSDREFTVMQYLYQGEQVKEIAARLNISPKTVSTYRNRIFEKFKVGSNAELVQYVVKNKILE